MNWHVIAALHADYLQLHAVEAVGCTTELQVAARMLWAALDTSSAGIGRYGDFLLAIQSLQQPLLQSLTQEAVQRFVLQAAGVQDSAASMQVWVWDEVNAIQLQPGEQTTFCQQRDLQDVLALNLVGSPDQDLVGSPDQYIQCASSSSHGIIVQSEDDSMDQ